MDSLDGYLQVPPDRSQILGRQSWKVSGRHFFSLSVILSGCFSRTNAGSYLSRLMSGQSNNGCVIV